MGQALEAGDMRVTDRPLKIGTSILSFARMHSSLENLLRRPETFMVPVSEDTSPKKIGAVPALMLGDS